MLTKNKLSLQQGVSLIEIIIAVGLFTLIVGGIMSSVLGVFSLNRLAEEQTQASLLAQEGIEAVYAIRDNNWSNIINGAYGLTKNTGIWTFANTSDVTDKYTRVITISDAYRDVDGNIAASGIVDPETKKVSVIVSWNYGGTRHNGVVVNQYITRWQTSKGVFQITPTPITVSPVAANCNAFCNANHSKPGTCTMPHQCTGVKAGKILNCNSTNICCCQ